MHPENRADLDAYPPEAWAGEPPVDPDEGRAEYEATPPFDPVLDEPPPEALEPESWSARRSDYQAMVDTIHDLMPTRKVDITIHVSASAIVRRAKPNTNYLAGGGGRSVGEWVRTFHEITHHRSLACIIAREEIMEEGWTLDPEPVMVADCRVDPGVRVTYRVTL